ncbi:MAG: OsmC family protein [Myxococcales bacterium]
MNVEELRAAQAPLKARYKNDPASAQVTLHGRGSVDVPQQLCLVETFLGTTPAGLHPATGGDGKSACSADLLLQALVACAGVTLGAVATSMGITVRSGRISAAGEVDFRGTLGVSREAPVGFKRITLGFELDTDANPASLAKLLELTERYCVVYQTLKHPPELSAG